MNKDVEKIKKYVRAANYLSVTQIYLQDNFLLERPLIVDDIKPKLFGHWGTCPGINFVYGQLNYLVKKHSQSTIFVLGPGHGVPALHSNLFLEGTMGKYHKKASLTPEGLAWVSKSFAWPYILSSHTSPDTPGQILEGGELGYSLATAYGAVLDNPDLMAVCMIGDGEAETGALAAAWHINKLIDPKTNGAVLPILHVNGLKISGPTIFGRMSDKELTALFTGYGYEPFIVSGEDVYEQMFETLENCYQKIKAIQKDNPSKPRFPMIILKTPKGWTTVKEINGKPIEGTIASHQVVAANARGDEAELKAVEDWLQSYKFEELYDKKNGFSQDILDIIPSDAFKIGDNPHVFGEKFQELVHPDPKKLAKKVETPGEIQSNSMRMAGTYLTEIFKLNKDQKNFRLMSPDETYSNRLDEVFTQTARAFVWPIEKMDKDITRDGRVMEMLSEHNMHGLAQGYLLTGRHTVFTTYEAFAQIISSMGHMYQKFLKYVRQLEWRRDIASMNYLLTSVAWRQEHNGYSHQNPSFITSMLEKQNDFVKVYFPADDNSMLVVMEETLSAKNQMNTVVAGKTPEPRWLTYEQAKKSLEDGLLTWDFASDKNPDVVLVGIGDYLTKEALAAIELIKKDAPEIKVRFVNIVRLQAKCTCEDAFHPQLPNAEDYFTHDKPVIVNFHGYPEVMKAMLFDVKNPHRFSVHGYQEQGGTTTPFDMQVRNNTDRYHLAMEVLVKMKEQNVLAKDKAEKVIKKYEKALSDHYEYIIRVGADPVEIENWQWSGKSPIIADVDEVMHADLLKEAKTIAVVGLSDNPERHSNRVATYFQKKGFRIIPINPNLKEVLGEKAYPDLVSVPKDIKLDIVDIFRKPEEVVPHLQEVVERGNIRSVWLQEGVSSQAAEDFAEDYGLTMVTNFCIMEAYKKLEK
ncbi:MAG TPA: phosphoketolase [Candidatus Saccharimonadales bacterium]|nr:phosphoketolase [Candidatus Saccharimonadales bacterium]